MSSNRKVISFYGTTAATAVKTLVSKRIGTPFTIKKISARFAQGCNNLVRTSFYSSYDKDAPAAGAPSGISVLRDYGQVDYVSGNDDTKIMQHEVDISESGSFLKVYCENYDTFVHSIDVQIEIEIKEG